MTDKEIIKALECCVNWGSTTSCADCPLCNTGCVHFSKLKETLDLINRKQAENSNLTSDLTSLQNDLTSAKAEIERLQKLLYSFLDTRNGDLVQITNTELEIIKKPIKAEAIKEIVEKLKEKKQSITTGHGVTEDMVSVYDINNLVKERAGE